MLLDYDEAIEMIGKGWFDSLIIVSSYIGENEIETKCLPLHFVQCVFGEDMNIEEINRYIDNLTGYDKLKIKLWLKEGKKHDKCEIQTMISRDRMLEMKKVMNSSIVPMAIKECFREMLHMLVD